MKKLFSRVLAFIIDIMICTFIIIGLSNISFINPNKTKVDEHYNSLSKVTVKYEAFKKYLEDVLDDAKLTEEESKKINVEFDSYSSMFKDIELNKEITNKEKDKLRKEVEVRYVEVSNEYGYKINRLNTYQTFISIVVYVLYFTVLQFILKGQTIGKKIFRLRVINNDGSKVELWKHFIRTLLVVEVLLVLIDLALVLNLKINTYLVANYYIGNFKYLYEMAFLVCMIIRDDQKSLHDLLVGTRVARFDKNGKEIEEILFAPDEVQEEVKEEKKNTKKRKKEVVEAIKVNDKKRSNKND